MFEQCGLWSPLLLCAGLALLAGLWWARRRCRLAQEMEEFYTKHSAARRSYKPWR